MAINRSVESQPVSVAAAQLSRVADGGLARHSHLSALLDGAGRHAGRDLSDSVHLLCSLYGRYPGLVEIALQRCPKGPVRDWLTHASDGFERERLYLVRLTSAVGPLPSTPGAAETESSLVAARHALETLAMSERDGCALGAATALVCDWWPVRRLLDRAAARVGIEAPAPSLPDEDFGDRDRRLRCGDAGQRSRARLRRGAIAAPAPSLVRPARSEGRSARRILVAAVPRQLWPVRALPRPS